MLLEDILPLHGLMLELLGRATQDLDGLGVRDARDSGIKQRIELVDQVALGIALQEGQLGHRLVQHLTHDALEEVLLDVHQLIEVAEADLRLDHPELGRVGLGVGVLRAERRAERVDALVGQRVRLGLQLAGHGKGRAAAEEVVLRLAGLAHLLRGDGEGVARPLGVVGGDQRRVDIDVAAGLEVVVDGLRGDGADAEDGLEQARARAQVRDVAQELEGMALGLQRIILRAVAHQREGLRLHLRHAVSALNEPAGRLDGRAVSQRLHAGKVLHLLVIDDLHRGKRGAVEKLDESDILLLAMVADPALHRHSLSQERLFLRRNVAQIIDLLLHLLPLFRGTSRLPHLNLCRIS